MGPPAAVRYVVDTIFLQSCLEGRTSVLGARAALGLSAPGALSELAAIVRWIAFPSTTSDLPLSMQARLAGASDLLDPLLKAVHSWGGVSPPDSPPPAVEGYIVASRSELTEIYSAVTTFVASQQDGGPAALTVPLAGLTPLPPAEGVYGV
jgi:hypothetical protein